MNADYADTVKWDDSRKTYVDAYGYSSTQRSRFAAPAKMAVIPSSTGVKLSIPVATSTIELGNNVEAQRDLVVEGDEFLFGDNTSFGLTNITQLGVSGSATITGGTTMNSQLTMSGTAPIVMNSNYIRLQGPTDSQTIRYNTTNSNVEINGFTGTRILTGTSGATNATQFDANGPQARKWARSSGAFSDAVGTITAVPQNAVTVLPLGTMTNVGVSGSAWTSATLLGGTCLVSPFAGTIRVSARVASFAPNASTSYVFLRSYHPTDNNTVIKSDELATITGTSADIRVAVMGIIVIATAGERIALIGLNDGATTKNMQILDYHVEYIA